MNREGTQPHIYLYGFSPSLPSHPGCHITLSKVPRTIQLVLVLIHFKYSSLAWRIPWTEQPGGLQSMGRWELDTTERLHFHFSLSCIGEGNGNPLQCSCLENPRDGGAWWAAVYRVAQSRTGLKRLSSSSSSSSSVYKSIPNSLTIPSPIFSPTSPLPHS